MKKKLFLSLLLFLLLVSLLDAKSFRDKGLYGSLSLSYTEDIYAGTGAANIQEKILQEYKLGYKGNIYSPKLLEYNLETIFRYDDTTNKTGPNDSESKIDSQDYRISASFIQSTKMPFSIYYKTVDKPTSFIYGNTVSKYTQDLKSKGIYGSMDLGLFRLSYKSTYDDDIFETNTSVDYRIRKFSEVSLSKNDKNYNLILKYNHLDQSTTSEVINISTREIAEVYDRANLSYIWRISDTLKLNADLNYYDSKYLLSESFGFSSSLIWFPKTKYSASISVNGTSTKQNTNSVDTLGNLSQNKDTTTSAGLSQNFSYQITKNLNFTESLTYLEYGSMNSNGENTSINFSLNYGMKINDTSRANISGSVSGRDTTLANTFDTNDTTTKEQSLSYTLQTGYSKQIEAGNSRFRITLRHSGSQSDLNVNANTIVNLNLSSKFWQMMNNNLIGTYSIDNSTYTYANTIEDTRDTKVSRMSVSDTLNYNGRLGIKGKTLASLGITYSIIDNNGNKITRIIPKLNVGLNYRFWQRLMYKLNAGVYKDLSYDYINYNVNTGLSYQIGKTAFSMDYTYNMTGYESAIEIASIEKSKLYIKVIRRF